MMLEEELAFKLHGQRMSNSEVTNLRPQSCWLEPGVEPRAVFLKSLRSFCMPEHGEGWVPWLRAHRPRCSTLEPGGPGGRKVDRLTRRGGWALARWRRRLGGRGAGAVDLRSAQVCALLPRLLRTRTAFPVPCRLHWAFS